jgi:putative membrane protein
MLAIKSLHIIFMVAWYAGLFYLPRLFVYHSMATDSIGIERFKVMERRLYRGIMTPSAILTIVFGAWLWQGYGATPGWLHAKLLLVVILIAFMCGSASWSRTSRPTATRMATSSTGGSTRFPRCRS